MLQGCPHCPGLGGEENVIHSAFRAHLVRGEKRLVVPMGSDVMYRSSSLTKSESEAEWVVSELGQHWKDLWCLFKSAIF